MTSALQLIARSDGRYYVPEVSLRLLQELPQEPFGVLTICGRYRTGKSTLMNLLTKRLNEPGSFQVGCTTKACTQGLWLYPEPVSFGPTPCFLIDTEGMASMDASANEDAQLLTLALLLSTVFLFNSTGCIDEPSLSTLGTTASLASQMLGGEKPDCALVWVLRDVTLQLRDSRGRLCSGDCYLETSL
ncbi:hypothetical protein EBZ37_13225, partial [bacterium]|nr:hypothetical protein [bacterium]